MMIVAITTCLTLVVDIIVQAILGSTRLFVRKLTFSTIVEQRTSPFGSWISLSLLSLRSSTHGELTGGLQYLLLWSRIHRKHQL